ncbi:MAG: alpha/beta fold hydrolase [Dehalococcoidia bacterium]|jgi:dienelactone hydrolase
MNPYEYPRDDFKPNLQLRQTTRRWRRYLVDFPAARPTPHEKNNTVLGDYYQPQKAANAPLVVLLHGVGDFSAIPCRMLARALAGQGMACFVLYSIMHSRRMTESAVKRFPHLTEEEWFENHRMTVIDLRQVIDWAQSRDEIDSEKVAAVGISFGGFISAITMGIEERLKAAVLIVTGGNSTKISWETRNSGYSKRSELAKAGYEENLKVYTNYLAEIEAKGLENVPPPDEKFWLDPMTFAHRLRQRPLLMLNARWDEAIPREATLDFWREAGKPPISWLPATHPTIWLWYPFIRSKIARFLKKALDTV